MLIVYISSRFFENQPNEICSHLSEKASKAGFLSPRSSKIIETKEEERRKRKRKSEDEERRRRQKAMVALLVFRIVTLVIVFGRTKTVGRKRSTWR